MKKYLAIVISLILLISFMQITNSYCEIVYPMYNETSFITADITISSGTASCFGIIVPISPSKTSVEVCLYKKTGWTWHIIASWFESNSNGSSVAEGTCSVDAGFQYKVIVCGKVFDDEGVLLETVYRQTHTVDY